MEELLEIYKRIEDLRNKGVKMKDIADKTNMPASVLSSLYSSVLPTFARSVKKGMTEEEALDYALSQVNNVSKKRLLGNLTEMKEQLLELDPVTTGNQKEIPFVRMLTEEMNHSAQEVYNYSGIYISYSLSSSSDCLKMEPYLISASENNDYVQVTHMSAYNTTHRGIGLLNNHQNAYIIFNERESPQLALFTIYLQLPMYDYPSMLKGLYLSLDYNRNPIARRIVFVKYSDSTSMDDFIELKGGLLTEEELTPEVEDKDVTVRKADLSRDIRSFISYAVGCMFGRYSLDVDGLAYAGGEWDNSKYSTFAADKDNIIPISDDEYFEDDIVGRFVKFVEVVYGKDTLDENLKFIADALGGKGQPKDVIRNYFLNDFYSDHCKIYQKRPIYWLFDSGKKNGFKALIYMHRYQPDTIARIRTDYVHEQQARYRTAIADLETRITNASTGERVKLNKQLKTLNDQATEIHEYEEKIHHLADQMISIDLDDGVKVNYAKFQDVLAKIK